MKLRSAVAILNEIRDGDALLELGQCIHDAIANVREHGKPNTITVTLTVGTLGESQHKLVIPPVIITAEVKAKLYEPKPPATIFFVDQDGNPVRQQQRQPDLDLKIAAVTGEGNG